MTIPLRCWQDWLRCRGRFLPLDDHVLNARSFLPASSLHAGRAPTVVGSYTNVLVLLGLGGCVLAWPLKLLFFPLGRQSWWTMFHMHLPIFKTHTLQCEPKKNGIKCPILCFRHTRDIPDHKEQKGTPNYALWLMQWLNRASHTIPRDFWILNILEIISTLKLTMKITNPKSPDYLLTFLPQYLYFRRRVFPRNLFSSFIMWFVHYRKYYIILTGPGAMPQLIKWMKYSGY